MSHLRRLASAAAALFSTACVSVTTLDGERLGLASPEFRAYVESVFREQNRVGTELALGAEPDRPGPRDVAVTRRLEAAEQALLDACEGLNAIAVGRRDGRRLGRLQEADAARRAPECERATRAAIAVLASVRQ